MDVLQVISNLGGSSTLSGSAIEEFKSKLRGDLIIPSDPTYDEVRVIWNGMHDKKPAMIAQCSGVADVIDSVKL